MPETADTTTNAPADTETVETPAPYTFPFDVPADLSSVSEEDLRALHAAVREHARTFGGLAPAETTEDTLAALRACRELALDVADELTGRANRATEAASLLDDVAFAEIEDLTGDDDPVQPEPTTEPEPAPEPTVPEPAAPAVTAAGRRAIPRVRDVARGTRAPQLPQESQATSRFGSMVTVDAVPGFPSGTVLKNFGEVTTALSRAAQQFPSNSKQSGRFNPKKRPIEVYVEGQSNRSFTLEKFTRRNVIEIRREFPDELRIHEGMLDTAAYTVASHAADAKRLPGGGLVQSMANAVKSGKSLTAAAGWCAPSETIYDLVETETEDGILDVPEMETPRGGWNIPINGGPEFAAIYGMIGNGGNTHLSEEDVINDVPKISVEIPCPPFEEVRLGVDYFSLTGGMLQRRGYPEAMARFTRAAVIALAHKINRGFIADIIAGSTNAGTVLVDPSGDDATSALLAAVDLAIMDAQYRNRGGFNSTMEVVLPRWVLVQMRAALTRRSADAIYGATDAMILDWFAVRNAVPRLVVDWQDQFSGVASGPGGSTPLLALPHLVEFLVYPAGTWVKAVQDVVSLDTIYDSTLLTTNQFISMFTETGWAALKMQPLSRRYTVHVDPSGVVGCCTAPDMALLS